MKKHRIRREIGLRNAIRIKKKPQQEEKKRNVLKRQNALDDEDVPSKTSFDNDYLALAEEINAELEELHIDYELPEDLSVRKRWIEGVRAARGKYLLFKRIIKSWAQSGGLWEMKLLP